MSGITIGIIGIVVFMLLMFLGIPVAASMALCGVVGSYFFLHNWEACYTFFSQGVINTFTSYNTAVVPMFMLMGELASESGLGGNMFSSIKILLGRVRGGLASAVQVVCALFGAICGSGSATAAMMCRIAYPEMKKHGYSDELACGCIASGSCLATLIPPSAILINYGLCVEESIGKLFVGGIITGIVLMVLFIITVQIWSAFDKNAAPPAERYTMKEKVQALKKGSFIELIIVFGVSMGGMFAGWMTPTESGAVGVGLMLIVTIVTRKFNVKMLFRACKNTLVSSGMMYCMLAGASVFGKFFTLTKIPSALASAVSNMNVHAILIVLIITIIYLVLGCVIDALPLMLLTAPIFLPVIRNLGYDAVWFGCYVVVIMGLAAVTPPVGLSCYLVSGFCDGVSLPRVFKGCVPFFLAFIVMGLLMAIIPGIATLLPNLIYG